MENKELSFENTQIEEIVETCEPAKTGGRGFKKVLGVTLGIAAVGAIVAVVKRSKKKGKLNKLRKKRLEKAGYQVIEPMDLSTDTESTSDSND